MRRKCTEDNNYQNITKTKIHILVTKKHFKKKKKLNNLIITFELENQITRQSFYDVHTGTWTQRVWRLKGAL